MLSQEHPPISTLRRVTIFLKVLVVHSVEDFRKQISAVSYVGPTILWSIAIKFFIPIFLSILWIIQFVNELINPYSTTPERNKFDYGSLALGLTIPISCASIIILLAIFPGGNFFKFRKAQEYQRSHEEEEHEASHETQVELADDWDNKNKV
jgi:hypothetical protein